MLKKKTLASLPYLVSIIFLPWWLSLSFQKSLKPWITNWWNTKKSKNFFNDIQEKGILEKLIELEQLLLVDEIIKECPEIHIQKLCIEIYEETIQLVKIKNEEHIHMILQIFTNIICFATLSGYSIICNEELVIVNSWIHEFLYNLSDIFLFILLLLFI